MLYLHLLSAMGIAERLHGVLTDCTRSLLQGATACREENRQWWHEPCARPAKYSV